MKQIQMWKVEIHAEADVQWEGLFATKPFVGILISALATAVEAHGDEPADCDEDASEWHYDERKHLLTILEVAHQIDDGFIEGRGWQLVTVAGTEIGSVQVETIQAFQAEEPA